MDVFIISSMHDLYKSLYDILCSSLVYNTCNSGLEYCKTYPILTYIETFSCDCYVKGRMDWVKCLPLHSLFVGSQIILTASDNLFILLKSQFFTSILFINLLYSFLQFFFPFPHFLYSCPCYLLYFLPIFCV